MRATPDFKAVNFLQADELNGKLAPSMSEKCSNIGNKLTIERRSCT